VSILIINCFSGQPLELYWCRVLFFLHFTFPKLEEVKSSRFLKIKCQKFTKSWLQVTQAFYITSTCIHFTLYFPRFGSSSVRWPRIIRIEASLTHADLVRDLKPYFTKQVKDVDADDLEIFLVDDFNKRQKLTSTTNLPCEFCEFCVKMTRIQLIFSKIQLFLSLQLLLYFSHLIVLQFLNFWW